MRTCWLIVGAGLLLGCTGPSQQGPPNPSQPPNPEHFILLGWKSSPTPGVVYRVYRAECAGQLVNGNCQLPETFTDISGDEPSLKYKDSGVVSGARYAYEVTAFDGTLESDPSNVVSVQIP